MLALKNYNQYYFYHLPTNKFKEVKGYPVEVIDEVELFVYYREDFTTGYKNISIVECMSGVVIAFCSFYDESAKEEMEQKVIKLARIKIEEWINKGVLDEIIETAALITGTSPAYRHTTYTTNNRKPSNDTKIKIGDRVKMINVRGTLTYLEGTVVDIKVDNGITKHCIQWDEYENMDIKSYYNLNSTSEWDSTWVIKKIKSKNFDFLKYKEVKEENKIDFEIKDIYRFTNEELTKKMQYLYELMDNATDNNEKEYVNSYLKTLLKERNRRGNEIAKSITEEQAKRYAVIKYATDNVKDKLKTSSKEEVILYLKEFYGNGYAGGTLCDENFYFIGGTQCTPKGIEVYLYDSEEYEKRSRYKMTWNEVYNLMLKEYSELPLLDISTTKVKSNEKPVEFPVEFKVITKKVKEKMLNKVSKGKKKRINEILDNQLSMF